VQYGLRTCAGFSSYLACYKRLPLPQIGLLMPAHFHKMEKQDDADSADQVQA
jgi:hypothetical protein